MNEASTWGRWGETDQRGAVNLIGADKVRSALALVELGDCLSLARPIEVVAPDGVTATGGIRHEYGAVDHGDRHRGLVETLSAACHGYETTHIDALCHLWDGDEMWNGRPAPDTGAGRRVTWGGIEQWRDGILTRGILLDLAALRPTGYVEVDRPATAAELAAAAERQGVQVAPGDALDVYSGRDRWEAENGRLWGLPAADGDTRRPGLDASCIDYFHTVDCSTVVWDMMDARPTRSGPSIGPHAAIHTLGLALVDNAHLGDLARRCRALERSDFLLSVAPLVVTGGTGSLVNPLAVL
jgi:kynurenine formamidase